MKIVKQLALFLESKPGELAGIGENLAKHKVNIKYAYSATRGAMVLRVDNLKKAARILKGR